MTGAQQGLCLKLPEWSFLICCGVLGLQADGMMGVFLPGCWQPLSHIRRPTSSPDLHELDFGAMVLGSGTVSGVIPLHLLPEA